DERLIITGDPEIQKSSPIIQAVIPGGWLRAYSDGFDISLPVKRRAIERRMIVGDQSMLDSPVGTSPRGGLGQSVLLHNGEFLYHAGDLSFATAAGQIAFSRQYRSHSIERKRGV